MLISSSWTVTAAGHPAKVIMNFYADDVEDPDTIEPYIVSIFALNEIENDRHFREARQFIQWYLDTLNYPDHHGLTGTIYIYSIHDGQVQSTHRYDSVDGYAGFFLHLLHRYVVKTGDIELLRTNWDKIEDIAYLIPALQDGDGLTRALPDSKIKYLMDNCEAYGGISAFLALEKLVGNDANPYYSYVRATIRDGIAQYLYDAETGMHAWAIEDGYQSKSEWTRYYPDAYAQLFLIYYDVLSPTVSDEVWSRFSEGYAANTLVFPIEQRIIVELTQKKMEGR